MKPTKADEIEELVQYYANEYWAADRTCSAEENDRCYENMARIMSRIRALVESTECDT